MSTSIGEIMGARKVLDGYVYETPVINSNALAKRTKHNHILLKCENLQRTGSYHVRGHMLKVIRTMETDMDVDNFVTFSTANGGAALSCAATNFQAAARVVIPKNLPVSITRSITHYGGHYVETKPTPEARKAAIDKLMEKYNKTEGKERHKACFVDPYQDKHVVTGYGTIGVELMLQTDCQVDCVVSPMGGGALLTGLAVAVKAMKPNVAVFGCRPVTKNLCDEYAYFKRGDVTADPEEKTCGEGAADSGSEPIPDDRRMLSADKVDKLLSARSKDTPSRLVNGIINVNNDEIRSAFRFVYERCKLVVDTKSAMAVAAVLAQPPELQQYKSVAIVVTGGNIDLSDVPKIGVAKL